MFLDYDGSNCFLAQQYKSGCCWFGLDLVPLTPDEDRAKYDKIPKIGDNFGQCRIAIVAKKGFKNAAQFGFVAEDVVDIPNGIDDGGNPTGFDKFMYSIGNQSGGEEEQQDIRYLEEIL